MDIEAGALMQMDGSVEGLSVKTSKSSLQAAPRSSYVAVASLFEMSPRMLLEASRSRSNRMMRVERLSAKTSESTFQMAPGRPLSGQPVPQDRIWQRY